MALLMEKPMNKMLVDGGASVNLMPYTTFCKLGKGPGDLMETNMMLKDFWGNASKTRGAINVELTIGSKTLLTTFFVIDGKRFIQFTPWSWLDSCKLLCAINHASVFDSMAWRWCRAGSHWWIYEYRNSRSSILGARRLWVFFWQIMGRRLH